MLMACAHHKDQKEGETRKDNCGCDAKLERKLTFQMKAGSALLKASRLQAQWCCAYGGVGGGRERFFQAEESGELCALG